MNGLLRLVETSCLPRRATVRFLKQQKEPFDKKGGKGSFEPESSDWRRVVNLRIITELPRACLIEGAPPDARPFTYFVDYADIKPVRFYYHRTLRRSLHTATVWN